jgi:hypothetical protein
MWNATGIGLMESRGLLINVRVTDVGLIDVRLMAVRLI